MHQQVKNMSHYKEYIKYKKKKFKSALIWTLVDDVINVKEAFYVLTHTHLQTHTQIHSKKRVIKEKAKKYQKKKEKKFFTLQA